MDQKDAFQARVARINAGRQFEAEDVIGTQTMAAYARSHQARKAARRGPKEPGPTVLMAPLALAVGLLAMLAGRVAVYHLSGVAALADALAAIAPAASVAAGGGFALALAAMLGLTRGPRLAALAAGFAAMLLGEAQIAPLAPELWASLYSPEYLSAIAPGAARPA